MLLLVKPKYINLDVSLPCCVVTATVVTGLDFVVAFVVGASVVAAVVGASVVVAVVGASVVVAVVGASVAIDVVGASVVVGVVGASVVVVFVVATAGAADVCASVVAMGTVVCTSDDAPTVEVVTGPLPELESVFFSNMMESRKRGTKELCYFKDRKVWLSAQ